MILYLVASQNTIPQYIHAERFEHVLISKFSHPKNVFQWFAARKRKELKKAKGKTK